MNLADKLKWRSRLISSKFTGHEPLMSWLGALKVCLRCRHHSSFAPCKILDQENDLLLVRMPDGRELFFPREQPLKILALIYEERCERYPVVVEYGDSVLQLGAAEGYFALLALEKASKVYLIEPLATWQRCLERTFSDALRKGKIEILPYAVGDREELMAFYVPDKWLAGSTLFKDWAQRQHFHVGTNIEIRKLTVNVKPLDMIVAKKRIERVDFIEADVEGAEWAMLRGARKTLERFKPKISMEVYHRPDDLPHILDLLTGIGYKVKLYRFGFREEGPPFGYPGTLKAWHPKRWWGKE